MSREPGDGRRLHLGISPLLQLVLMAGVGVWIVSMLLPMIRAESRPVASGGRAKEQMMYLMNPPNVGSPEELGGLPAQGWRITQVSSAGCPSDHSANYRFLMVLEHPTSKEQHWWFINPYSNEGQPAQMTEQLKNGFKITQISSTSTPAGGGWTYRTVFVLER